ncbi:MAG: radical SAM protein [Spirochaetota bacterium]|nr:radical SAM protein [Spirochaetota bacterium]
MLLISPPAARITEAYPALARLGGALKAHNIPYRILDGNLEGLMHLINSETSDKDTWTKRAVKGKEHSLAILTSTKGYSNFDTYKSHIKRLNRLLEKSDLNKGHEITLANFSTPLWSPLSSMDLKYSGDYFEDNPFYSWFSNRIPRVIEEMESNGNKIKFIGFSVTFLSQALTAFAMAGFIRKIRPDIKIVWGGGLITSWEKSPGINNLFNAEDIVIYGPGEIPLLKLFEIDSKSNFMMPDYEFAIKNRYLSPGFILAYNTSVGCPWKKCTFCPEKYEDNPYISEKHTKVTEELKILVEKYNPVLIHLTDSEISPAMLKALAADPPGTQWYGFCRFTKLLTDEKFCQQLANSGCRMLSMGLESGDKEVLKAMKKGIKLEDVPVILENLKNVGIGTYIYVLFGTPAEDRDAALKTRDFVVKYAHLIDFINAAVFNLPVNSEEAQNLNTDNFYEGDLSLYTGFKHPKGWGRKEIRQFLKKDFSSVPEIREVLNRVPPVFDSSHAPFFLWKRKTEDEDRRRENGRY